MTITEHRFKNIWRIVAGILLSQEAEVTNSLKATFLFVPHSQTQSEKESIFTSSMTTAQRKMTMERYEARREKSEQPTSVLHEK